MKRVKNVTKSADKQTVNKFGENGGNGGKQILTFCGRNMWNPPRQKQLQDVEVCQWRSRRRLHRPIKLSKIPGEDDTLTKVSAAVCGRKARALTAIKSQAGGPHMLVLK